jgi:PLP dependent protein
MNKPQVLNEPFALRFGPMNNIATTLASINQRIGLACLDAGRPISDVNLLAVSKTQTIEAVQQAVEAGQKDFGENYLQDAEPKISHMPNAVWHFIGAIQSNKTRAIAEKFSWVHSISSEKIARRLSEQRPSDLAPLQIMFQINVSGESSKSGLRAAELASVIDKVMGLPGLRLRGLMTVPTATTDTQLLRHQFAQLRQLRNELTDQYSLLEFDQLSMGMTADFQLAIAEGSTWVRVGTAIFGTRNKTATLE